MGKKKTRQNSNNILVPDPSESSDASVIAKPANKIVCPHLNKSVDWNALRKSFRNNDPLSSKECVDCKKKSLQSTSQDIWLCLKCGTCCCGLDQHNHRLNHFETPRSDSHCMFVKIETQSVWCYECKLEIPADSSKKLHSCIDFVKQQHDRSISSPLKHVGTEISLDGSVDNSTSSNKSSVISKKMSTVPSSNSKIKGLMNLQNTCFFNSVLQCLAQTPGLIDVLSELQEPGKQISFPLNAEETLIGELGKGGPVSESLLKLLNNMNRTDVSDNVLVPRELLNALRKKCPVFEGGDQHDAHELLRHLLDVVRTEDLRRYQRIILKMNGLATKVNPREVNEDKRKWIKEVNQKVSDELPICPDQIFKGTLVSQLQCQTCFHTSDRYESFLDLSLPVNAEKPVPPVITRKKNQLIHKNDVPDNDGTGDYQSSCLSKKELRQVRKRARCKKKNYQKEDDKGEPSISEEDRKESSDADVEDNDEISIEDKKMEKVESGYNSEKPSSSRTSPIIDSQNDIDDSATSSLFCTSDSLAITSTIGDLRLEDNCQKPEEKHCLLSLASESGLGSSIVSVQDSNLSAVGGQFEPTYSIDSSDSIKGNPSSTSRNLSAESLHEIGLGNNTSVSSEQEDIQNPKMCDMLADSNLNEIMNVEKDVSKCKLDENNVYNKNTQSNCDSLKSENFDNSELCYLDQQKNFSNYDGDKQLARSSPVEITSSQSLDSNLLSMSLESYKTEFLSSIHNNIEESVNYSSKLESNHISSYVSQERLNEKDDEPNDCVTSSKSDYQEMGFVLVNGICDTNHVDSLSCSVPTKKTVKNEKITENQSSYCDSKEKNKIVSSGNENENEEVSPDYYKNRHITLAPRYQCTEGECSIMSCLNHFTAIEMMAGNNKVGCEACTQRQNKGVKDKERKTVYRVCTKRLFISSPPSVLILHLKRFQVTQYSFTKLSCHVVFPLVLDLAPFCSNSVQKMLHPNQTQILYSLFGVVAHSGTLRSGHYVAYVKVRNRNHKTDEPNSGTWFYVSDSHAREVSEECVLNSQAYLLFYERFL